MPDTLSEDSNAMLILYNPCLSQSVNLALPSCAKLFTPCSLKSIRPRLTSCAGALLTLWTMIVGSVSRTTQIN